MVLIHRVPMDSYVQELFDRIRSREGLAILDIDDLIFDPRAFEWIDSPDFQDPVRARLYQEDMGRYAATMEACQAVTASTRILADTAQEKGKPAWIHRNAFSLEMLAGADRAFSHRRSQPEQLVIGYASGTPTHDQDFEVAKPALMQALTRYPHVELWLIGDLDPGSGWGTLQDRIRHQPRVPWRDLPKLLVQFDINLAPLVTDNPFAQSKSEIKYVEAGLVGVPTIASPTAAFRHGVRGGENGLLAADQDQWLEALSMLIENDAQRQALGAAARADVLQRYHPQARARELLATLNEIQAQFGGSSLWPEIQAASPSPGSQGQFWSSREAELHPTLAEMAAYTLRNRGLKTFMMQLWIYFRRALTPIFPYRSGQ